MDKQNLDLKLLKEWLDKGRRLTEEFELDLWVGRYPEEELADIALLMDVMNQQPFDDLEIEDIRFTPERVREIEEGRLAGGTKAWTMYVRDRQTGKLAWYTAVHISPNRPQQLSQGDTGVFPAYRGRGLGHRTVCGKSRRSRSVGCGKGERDERQRKTIPVSCPSTGLERRWLHRHLQVCLVKRGRGLRAYHKRQMNRGGIGWTAHAARVHCR